MSLFAALVLLASPAVMSVHRIPTGALIHEMDGVLRIEPLSPRAFRIRFSVDGRFPPRRVPVLLLPGHVISFRLLQDRRTVSVRTGEITATIDRSTGSVSFSTVDGKPFLTEQPGSRKLTPIDLPHAYRTEEAFTLQPDEAIYGLGQHQDGFLDHRGSEVTLEQQNREVAIPFEVSSRGYGVLWNNPAGTKVGVGVTEDRFGSDQVRDSDGPRGLTGSYYRGRNFETLVDRHPDSWVDFDWSKTPPPGLPHDDYSVRWTAFFVPPKTGTYSFKTVSDDGVRLWIGDQKIIDDWTIHPAQTDVGRIQLAAGKRYSIRLDYFQAGDQAVIRLTQLAPTGIVQWASEASEGIDYCVFYGPSIDRVIAGYRNLTGQAPLPPKWALGYWQSKERYATQQEWGEIAAEYRKRRHPIDVLVQDWFYWDPYPWGSHEFDPKRYPDPAAGVRHLHQDHLHTVISVWGMFAPDKPGYPDRNLEPLAEKGYLLPASLRSDGMRFYDAFNAGARKLYWEQIRDDLLSKGFDGWWLDASEPELDMQAFRRSPTAAGPGALVLNAWPLMHTIGVSQGQLAAAPEKRPVILTRSAYAGQQRTGAITWSGDITATWKVLADQIPAGLNFSLSGNPYWTTDIGAFFAPRNLYPGGASDPTYRELFTRWFEYGAFCPIFRVHGTDFAKEMWRFGPEIEKVLDRYDRLRYRLMPYIYSQAWQVTSKGATMMRALPMDFPSDARARECKDEFLFGPSMLICPVLSPGATTRSVYLPKGAAWYDFWTGRFHPGGGSVVAPAPIDKMPIFVRAGSILPLGPEIQYVDEKPADPIELRVYPGGRGSFVLYEDQGEGQGYKEGRYATIPISFDGRWLTIGRRQGSFSGMLHSRRFRIVVVGTGSGNGPDVSGAGEVVVYRGKEVRVRVR